MSDCVCTLYTITHDDAAGSMLLAALLQARRQVLSDRGLMSAGKRQADSQADEGGATGIPAAQPGQWQAHQGVAAQILF